MRGAWQACGARVIEMGAAEHDAMFRRGQPPAARPVASRSSMSLLPRADAASLLGHAGGGLSRRQPRIAASHPEMWRDICLANRDALLGELDALSGRARPPRRGASERSDGETLERAFERRARRGGRGGAWTPSERP